MHQSAVHGDAVRGRRPALWQAYLAAGAFLCLVYAVVPPFAGSGPLMNLLGLSPVVAIVVGVLVDALEELADRGELQAAGPRAALA